MADGLKDGQTGPLEGAGGPILVECLLSVMERIRTEVTDAFFSAPRGGVEIGGVLYGAREDRRIVILAARPLDCEHAFGPSFALSASDHARLAALLDAPRRDRGLPGMRALGWYHSHTRSELELRPQDLEIHDRYFPEPGQVALVLRPAPTGPVRTCFYWRGTSGSMHSTERYSELEATPRIAAARPLEAPREAHPPVVTASGGQAAAVAPALDPSLFQAFKAPLDPLKFEIVDAPPDPRPLPALVASPEPPRPPIVEASPDPPQFQIVGEPQRRRWGLWASLVVVVACLLAGGSWYVFSDRGLPMLANEPPPGFRLQATDQQGQLEVLWNGAAPALRAARGGSLEFLDGSTRRVIPLDPQLLRSGAVYYARLSDTVRIHLTVEKPDGSKLEDAIIFVGQTPSGSPSGPQPEVAGRQAGEEAAAAERRRAEADKEELLKREREKELERKRLAEQKKSPPIPTISVQVKPETSRQAANPLQSLPVTRAASTAKPPSPPYAPQSTLPPPVASPPPAQASKPLPAATREPAVAVPPTVAAKESGPPPPVTSSPPTQTSKPLPAATREPAVAIPPTVAAKPPAAGLAPLTGEWTLARSFPSGSPFRPDWVTVSLFEDGNWLRGAFAGRYRTAKASGLKPEVSFVFGGPLRGGTVKLPWSAPDGVKGEIELIRLPNNSEALEVVWYLADRKFVFDDVVVRVKQK